MLANHVESAKPSAMVNDHLADDAFIQAQSVTTALEKAGKNASKSIGIFYLGAS